MRRSRSSLPRSARAAPLSDRWQVAIDEFLAGEDLKGRAPRTLQLHRESLASARAHLDAVGAGRDPALLGRPELSAMVMHMRRQGMAPRTINLRLQSLAQLYRHLQGEGVIADNPAAAMPRQRVPKRPPRALMEDDALRLLRQPDRTSFVGLRDSAIMLLMLDTGMRLYEVIAIEMDDLDFGHHRIQLRAEVNKTREGRTAFFGPDTAAELRLYLRERGDPATRRLFISRDERPLARATLQGRIAVYAARAGVKATPHALRHTLSRMYLMSGGDAFSLQQLLGHRDAASTAVYARLWVRDLQALHGRHAPVAQLRRNQRGVL